MLYHLLYPLFLKYKDSSSFFKIFNLFQYITFRAAMAVLTTLLLSFIFGPMLIRYLRSKKIGQSIRELGPQSHQTKSGTPTMGGVLIIGSTVISVLLWARLDNVFIWLVLASLAGFGLIGFIDDYKKLILKNSVGLKARYKFLLQIVLSLAIVSVIYFLDNTPDKLSSQVFLPFVNKSLLNLYILMLPFGVLLLVATSNAVNLTDGLDGLAIGCTLFVIVAFTVLTYLSGHIKIASYLKIPFIKESAELTIFCAALVGSSLGFLWFNANPAEVFMGDTGSLALGGAVGTLALMIKKETLLVIVGGIFVAEALSVILQVGYYKWKKKRIFLMAPLHHHFEMKGMKETKVVIRFWIVGIILAMVALATLKIR